MCEDCEWENLLEQIDELFGQEKYDFASDTLQGIYDWVGENEHCTESQQGAVQNIENAR